MCTLPPDLLQSFACNPALTCASAVGTAPGGPLLAGSCCPLCCRLARVGNLPSLLAAPRNATHPPASAAIHPRAAAILRLNKHSLKNIRSCAHTHTHTGTNSMRSDPPVSPALLPSCACLPQMIKEIKAAVTIPVMAKARIGHFVEAQILEAVGIDYIDESEVRAAAGA